MGFEHSQVQGVTKTMDPPKSGCKNWLEGFFKFIGNNNCSLYIHIGINTTYNYSTWQPWFSAMSFKRLGAEAQILQIWMIWCQKLHFHFLGSYLDTLRGQRIFSSKYLYFEDEVDVKYPFLIASVGAPKHQSYNLAGKFWSNINHS